MTLYPKLIIDTLRHVRYPGKDQDIVSLGMVADDIKIDGRHVEFSLVFDRQNDPFARSLVKAAEQAILLSAGKDVDIEGNIRTVFRQHEKPEPPALLPKVKNIIAVFSGKGGVGKSTVSANLAVSLAQAGYRMGLLDADIHGPSIPKMFGVENESPVMNESEGRQLIAPVEKYGVKLLSIGFFVKPDNALVWRGSMASNALRQLISEGDWGELDYFIIDLPPGTGDIQLTLVQMLGITGAIVVTTPQAVALVDARKGIDMFTGEKVNVPVLGLVENMAWFTPSELPENRYYIFGRDGGKHLAEELNIPLLAQIPLVQSLCEAGDSGSPAALNPESITGMYFNRLAQKVTELTDSRNRNFAKTKKVEIRN